MLPNTQSKTGAFGHLVVAGGCLSLLGACGGEQVEQSSESFSAMADVHNDASVIESTAEIDKLLVEQDPDGNWSASVFEPDTVLLDRTDSASDVSASNSGAGESASEMSPGQSLLITVIFMFTPNTRLMAMPWGPKQHLTMRIALRKAKPLPIPVASTCSCRGP